MITLTEKIKQVIKSAKEKGAKRLTKKISGTIITVVLSSDVSQRESEILRIDEKNVVNCKKPLSIGKIVYVLKKKTRVKESDVIAKIEGVGVFKGIEQEFVSLFSGIVREVFVSIGDITQYGTSLLEIKHKRQIFKKKTGRSD